MNNIQALKSKFNYYNFEFFFLSCILVILKLLSKLFYSPLDEKVVHEEAENRKKII